MTHPLEIRAFKPELDYADVCEWWKARNWPPVQPTALPPIGLLCEDKKHKYCAIWLYLSGGDIAWSEWLVTNPESPIKKRKTAMELLVSSALQAAAAAGAKSVFTSLANKNLIKLFQKVGFSVSDAHMTNMVARVA